MLLTSYKTNDPLGGAAEFDLGRLIGDSVIYVSSCNREGVLIQILLKNPEAISRSLPMWVHDEFWVFCGHWQLMLRQALPIPMSVPPFKGVEDGNARQYRGERRGPARTEWRRKRIGKYLPPVL